MSQNFLSKIFLDVDEILVNFAQNFIYQGGLFDSLAKSMISLRKGSQLFVNFAINVQVFEILLSKFFLDVVEKIDFAHNIIIFSN